jgi:heptosyltransferase I
MTRIAVFRFSALGDCVLVVPAIRALQKQMPEAEIYWIIEESLLPLFQCLDGIQFIPVKKPRSLGDYLRLKKQFAVYHFDILLAMQSSLRANLIYPLIKAKRKIGFDAERGRELHGLFVKERIPFRKEHLLEGFLSFVDYLQPKSSTSKALEPSWGFNLPATEVAWAKRTLLDFRGADERPVLALNAAASKIERCCTADFYACFLIENGHLLSGIVLTGAASEWEKRLAQEIEQKVLDSGVSLQLKNLTGKTTLLQLAALLQEVDVLVAPDTGPVHLAGALGTKVLGLYGVAPPELTGPYNSQNLVLNKYPHALKVLKGKAQEEAKWGERVHHAQAMSFFEQEELSQKLQLALS